MGRVTKRSMVLTSGWPWSLEGIYWQLFHCCCCLCEFQTNFIHRTLDLTHFLQWHLASMNTCWINQPSDSWRQTLLLQKPLSIFPRPLWVRNSLQDCNSNHHLPSPHSPEKAPEVSKLLLSFCYMLNYVLPPNLELKTMTSLKQEVFSE